MVAGGGLALGIDRLLSDSDEPSEETAALEAPEEQLEDLSDEALGREWRDVMENFTGTLRGAGFPRPGQVPYEETGTPESEEELRAAYFQPDTGYRKQFLELWNATEGRLEYVNEDLRTRIHEASTPEDMWALVADFTGRIVRPLLGESPSTTPTTDAGAQP